MMQYDDDIEESTASSKIDKDGERPKMAKQPQLRTGARENASDMLHAKEKAAEQEAEEEDEEDYNDPEYFAERQDA